MTVYDPIEFGVGDIRGGYGVEALQVKTPGYETRKGYFFTAIKNLGEFGDAGFLNAKISWTSGSGDENLPIPEFFQGGEPNVCYKITIQAIDLTEEE